MRVGKVYKNIEDSDYVFDFQRFTFYFSSKFYIEKFKKELDNYIDIEQKRLIKRYDTILDSSEYLALSLYKKIEKRGFRVYFKNDIKNYPPIRLRENETFSISLSYLKYI